MKFPSGRASAPAPSGVFCEAVATADVSAGVEFFEASAESCKGLSPAKFYDAAAGECVAVAVCTSPGVLDGAANLCNCPAPNIGTNGAAAPGDCAVPAPSVEVCGGLTPSQLYDAAADACVAASMEVCEGLIPAQFYDAAARECAAVAECDLPSVRNAGTNLCDCPAPNIGENGAVAPGVCAAPSAEVCGRENQFYAVTVFHGASLAACVEFATCEAGATLNSAVNRCECAGAAVLNGAGTGCLCESPNEGTPESCAAPSAEVCKGLTPEEFYDAAAGACVAAAVCASPAVRNAETNLCECPLGYSGAGGVCNADVTVSFSSPANGTLSAASGGGAIQDGVTVAHGTTVTFTASPASGYEVSIWTGVCAGAVGASCEAVATVDVSAGVEFSEAGAEVCAGLIPAKFYDATAGECAAFATCDLPEVRNAETNRCECLAGYVVKDGKCEVCPPGQGVLADGTCGVCPAEQVIYGGECVACESGQVALGGVCVAVADCPAGATLNSAENRCECAWDAVLNEAGTSCVCESPNVGTPEDCHAENSLHAAAGLGDLDAVNHFIAAVHGGKSVVEVVNEKNGAGETPLHQAARNGHAAVVAALIAAGAEVNAADTAGFTPLHQAALNGHVVIVLTLIAEKADVNMDDDNFGFTSLHQAANKGHVSIVSALIAADADVNARTKQDRTPLWLADVGGRADVVAVLIAEGGHYGEVCANPAAVNPAGRDPSCVCAPPNVERKGACFSQSGDLGELSDDVLCVAFGGTVQTATGGGEVCSGMDKNGTFCIMNSVDAFPCRGLFKHLGICNVKHNRPALNPFFCGENCGEKKAVGGECLP